MRSAIALALLLATPAWAQDAPRGRTLYELHAASSGQRFTLEDLDDIAEYLNQSHYRLEK